jgi:hypothetical protein
MTRFWEVVSLTLLGVFTMGQVISLDSAAKNIGAFGTSTSGVVEVFFFFAVAAVVYTAITNYF